MKKRIVSLLCAAALVLSLAGCALSSSPETVGTIGDTTISTGMYLLSQYQGYFSAVDLASKEPLPEDETAPDYSAMSVKDFLKETVVVDGAEISGADLVDQQTLKNVQYYAAVNAAFSALNGELTPEQLAQAEADAKSVWESGKELYEKNGFSLATIQEYQYTLHKASMLIDLVYGENGSEAVSQDELLAHLGEDIWYVHSATIPLYSTANFQIVEENVTKVKELGQKMLDDFNAQRETAESPYQLFADLAKETLPRGYEIVGNPYEGTNPVVPDLLNNSMVDNYFGTESGAKIRDLQDGDVVMLDDSGYALEFFQRVDPVAANEWTPELNEQFLFAAFSEHLQSALLEYGESLTNGLDTSVMKKLPASKIVPTLG